MQRQAVLYFGRAMAVTSLESRNISDGYMGKVNWLQFRDHGTIYIGKDLQESNLQSSGEAKMCIFSDCREHFSHVLVGLLPTGLEGATSACGAAWWALQHGKASSSLMSCQ